MASKRLPIGISSFREIISEGYVYVDKTADIKRLVEGKYYFLSRPRRFGKSLLVDTLKELFEGAEELFEGLAIHSEWAWETKHPVIHISFANGIVESRAELNVRVMALLQENAQRLGVELDAALDNAVALSTLISAVQRQFDQKVVVLIDEYDKPILDNLANSELHEITRGLQSLYSAIKDQDNALRFAFLTGVSKFSKVSVFSGLNNLEDISIGRRFGSLCGYTHDEVATYFSEVLHGVDMEKLRQWYNGYNWLGEKVYNPFDILLFLQNEHSYRPYWFETGTPSFLLQVLRSSHYHLPLLDSIEATYEVLGSFDTNNLQLETLLFQSGYITITGAETVYGSDVFELGFPNHEVRTSFNQLVLKNYLLEKTPKLLPAMKALQQVDLTSLEKQIVSLFSGIANDNYRNNKIAQYEGYYASVMYAYLNSLGAVVTAEDVTNKGRIDLTLQVNDSSGEKIVYILEFKVTANSAPEFSNALSQIKEKNYAEKYKTHADQIILVGITFSEETRNIASFAFEVLANN